jgi:hypothetical protein
MRQHTFINKTSRAQSRREVELQSAIARSHAARASWRFTAVSARRVRDTPRPETARQTWSSTNDRHRLKLADQATITSVAPEDEAVEEIPRTPEQVVSSRAWQWIKGTSSDDFEIVPGSNTGIAPFALEFCKHPSERLLASQPGPALTFPCYSDSNHCAHCRQSDSLL